MTTANDLPPTVETSDADLIAAARERDNGAYAALFERHRDAATRLARQLTSGPEADDLVSEAFTRIYALLIDGKGPDQAFRAYLLTSIRRIHVDQIRAGRRERPTEDEHLDAPTPFVDTAELGFERTTTAAAFASLPERWQLVLWHLDVEGEKPADVAPLLGMSANSVSALAYRAREGLREAYLQQHVTAASESGCSETTSRLAAYVRGGLSQRQATKIENHLDECRSCTGLYLELREFNSGLAAILGPAVLGVAALGYLGPSALLGASVLGASGAGAGGAGSGAVGAGGAGGSSGTAVAATAAAGLVVAGAVAAGAVVMVRHNNSDDRVAKKPSVVASVNAPKASAAAPAPSAATRAARPSIKPKPSATPDTPTVSPEPTRTTPAPAATTPTPAPTTSTPSTPAPSASPTTAPQAPAPTPSPTPTPVPYDVSLGSVGITAASGKPLTRVLTFPITAVGTSAASRNVVATINFDRNVTLNAASGWTCTISTGSSGVCTTGALTDGTVTPSITVTGVLPSGNVSISSTGDTDGSNNSRSFAAAPWTNGN